MGHERIDGSDPFRALRPPEDDACSEETKTCGDTMSRGKPVDESDVAHPEPKPSDLAAVAKNMATPRLPSDAQLRAEYGKMTDAQLDAQRAQLSARLTKGASYAGEAEDNARFRAVESVMADRIDCNVVDPATSAAMTESKRRADENQQEAEGLHVSRQPHGYGVEKGGAAYKSEHVTLFDGSVKLGTAHTGVSTTAMHGQIKGHAGPVKVEAHADGAGIGWDAGTHNGDGSVGLHGGGGLNALSGELTAHVPGVASVTVGVGVGATAEGSVGLKDDHGTEELCVRGGLDVIAGVCIPVWTGRM